MVAYDYVFDVLRLTLTPRLTNADTAFIFRIRIIVLRVFGFNSTTGTASHAHIV